MSTTKVQISFADIVCKLCKEVYQDPRVLSCGDTFCLQCLEKFVDTELSTNDTSSCPVCKRQTKELQQPDLNNLPKNRSVAIIVSEAARSQKTKGKKGHRQKGFNGFCKRHDDQKILFYCRKCNDLVCAMCKMLSHPSHSCVDVDLARIELDNIIKNGLVRYRRQAAKTNKEIDRLVKVQEQKRNQLIEERQLVNRLEKILTEDVSLQEKAEVADDLRSSSIYKEY